MKQSFGAERGVLAFFNMGTGIGIFGRSICNIWEIACAEHFIRVINIVMRINCSFPMEINAF